MSHASMEGSVVGERSDPSDQTLQGAVAGGGDSPLEVGSDAGDQTLNGVGGSPMADEGPRQPLPADLLGQEIKAVGGKAQWSQTARQNATPTVSFRTGGGGQSEDGSLDETILSTVMQGDHRERVFDGTRARGPVAQRMDVEPGQGGGNRPGTATLPRIDIGDGIDPSRDVARTLTYAAGGTGVRSGIGQRGVQPTGVGGSQQQLGPQGVQSLDPRTVAGPFNVGGLYMGPQGWNQAGTPNGSFFYGPPPTAWSAPSPVTTGVVPAGYASLPTAWTQAKPPVLSAYVPVATAAQSIAPSAGLTPSASVPMSGRRRPNHKWTQRFSGRGATRLDLYLAQFEWIATLNAWDDEEKAGMLINSLEGDALKILRALPESAGYSEIVDALKRRFPVVDCVNYEAALEKAVRKTGENAADFAARLEELVERAMPDSTEVHRARVVRERFVRGQPAHIRQPLTLQQPATLAEAVLCVLNFDKWSGVSFPSEGETSVK